MTMGTTMTEARRATLSIHDQLRLERGLRCESAATRLKAGGMTMDNHGLYLGPSVDDYKARMSVIRRARDPLASQDPRSYVTAQITSEAHHTYVDAPPIDAVLVHGWASRGLIRVAQVSPLYSDALRAYHGEARDRVAAYRAPGVAVALNKFVALVPLTKAGRKILDRCEENIRKATAVTGLADELGTVINEFARQNKSREDKARHAMAIEHAMALYAEACACWNDVGGGDR